MSFRWKFIFFRYAKKGQIQKIPEGELLFSFGSAGSVGVNLNDSNFKKIGSIGEIIQSLSSIELINRIKNIQDN